MPVFPEIPNRFFKCTDGTYSDHNRPGACNWHGGLKQGAKAVPVNRTKKQGSQNQIRPGEVVLVPVQSVNVRREWFQGRATPYSDRSVQNIIAAVDSGRFLWANLDPLTLWAAPDGKLYVLSGHSRLEAFTRLCKAGATAQGKDFCSIPAKIEGNITLAQAKEIALQSNTLSTKETPLERAAYYATLRAQGNDEKAIQDAAKRLEGKNYTSVIAYSYLDPQGKTYAALQALEQSGTDSSNIITSVARWIGNARKTYPLTNYHEGELYDWLINRRGYGTGRGQVSNEREFKERLASIINRRMTFGNLEESLNIQAFLQRSPVEQQYDQQLTAAKKDVVDAENALKAKIRELTSRGATEAQVQQITEALEATLRRARIRYQELISKRGDVSAAARNELSLFAGLSGTRRRIGAIVDTRPPGRTLCLDDMFSTLPHGPGVCSYHGGSTQTRGRKAPVGVDRFPAAKKKADAAPYCNDRNFSGIQTFEYVRSELKKLSIPHRYSTQTASNSKSIILWELTTDIKLFDENGRPEDVLRMIIYNGGSGGRTPAIRIIGIRDGDHWCATVPQAVEEFARAYNSYAKAENLPTSSPTPEAKKTHTYKLGDRVKVDRGDFAGNVGTVINTWFDPNGNEWVTLYYGINLGNKKLTGSVSADLTHLATREEDKKIYWEKAFYKNGKLIAELGFRGVSYQLKFVSTKPYDFEYTPKTSFSNKQDFEDFQTVVHKNQVELITAAIDRVGRETLPASFFGTDQQTTPTPPSQPLTNFQKAVLDLMNKETGKEWFFDGEAIRPKVGRVSGADKDVVRRAFQYYQKEGPNLSIADSWINIPNYLWSDVLKFYKNLPFFPSSPYVFTVSYEEAKRAYQGTSQVPEERAKQYIESEKKYLDDLYKQLAKGRTPEQIQLLNMSWRNFIDKRLLKQRELMSARSGIISVLVTGAGNFPTRRNQKRNDALHKKESAFYAWEEKYIKAMKKDRQIYPELALTDPIRSGEDEALILLKNKLAELEKNQERMKEINKIVRSGKNVEQRLSELGYNQKSIQILLQPDYGGRVGIPAYQLTNNNANIKRLRDRVAQEEKIQATRATGPRSVDFEGGTVEEALDDNRLRIFFDDKPDAEMRKTLKGSAWKWAPSVSAWQRQLTDNAWSSAASILNIKNPTRNTGVSGIIYRQQRLIAI